MCEQAKAGCIAVAVTNIGGGAGNNSEDWLEEY